MLRLRLLILLAALLLVDQARAQDRPLELGLALESNYYIGDLDRRGLGGRHRPGLSLVASYQRRLHWSWNAALALRPLSGSNEGEATVTGGWQGSFERTLLGLSLGGNYYFLPLSLEERYLRSRSWSPFVGMGAGLALGGRTSEAKLLLAPSLYLSLGAKWLLSSRLSASLSWTIHRSTSSRLEDTGQMEGRLPQGLLSPQGIKAQDSFGCLSLALSLRIGSAPCIGCN